MCQMVFGFQATFLPNKKIDEPQNCPFPLHFRKTATHTPLSFLIRETAVFPDNSGEKKSNLRSFPEGQCHNRSHHHHFSSYHAAKRMKCEKDHLSRRKNKKMAIPLFFEFETSLLSFGGWKWRCGEGRVKFLFSEEEALFVFFLDRVP